MSISYKAEYEFGVDPKRRVQVPAKWRDGEEERFTLILWKPQAQTVPCILVLPPRTYAKLELKLEGLPFGDPEAEALRRELGSKSDDVVVDKAGRICLPEWMATGASVADKAILIGLYDRFQIWRPEFYNEIRKADALLAPRAQKFI